MNRAFLLLVPTVAVGLVAGCASTSSSGKPAAGGSSPSTSASASCTPASMQTKKAGTLTIGADQPVYEPWYVDNDPTNGKGFEDAVAYAVATKLGYQQTQVKWVRVPFDSAVQPGPKKFDIDLDEFSITPARKKAVDFSSPYYDVAQTVIAVKGSKGAAAKSLGELKGLRLGAQVGTTSYTAITDVIKPGSQPRVYNTNDDAKAALQAGQIDALVVDLPTAFFITSAQLKNGLIVGQVPPSGGKAEQFGILLDKDSPLTSCVSQAVDALRQDGTLQKIQDKWLAQTGGAPVLK
jgi:polar amino acid transport system substrate-binding protein